MLRLLHTADWQIGKLFGQFEPDQAALLADARYKAVERLATLASEQALDLVLVAGDVFDAQGVADRTIHRLFNALAAFSGRWVMLPGNHDAALSESVWTRAARLHAIPGKVTLCLTPEPLLLEELGVAILPAPLTQRNTFSDLSEWFASAETPPEMLRIGLAHGSVQGILAEAIDSANPIAAGRAEQAGLDYLALGDWHGTRQVDARTWYSGTPESDRFRANQSGQALLVELAGRQALPAVTPLNIGRHCWRSDALTLQVPSDVEQALQHIAKFSTDDVVQLSLSGQTDLAGHRRLRNAIGQAEGRVHSLLADLSALRLEPTADDIDALQADGYLGEVVDELRTQQQGSNAEVARDALTLLAGILDERRRDAGRAANAEASVGARAGTAADPGAGTRAGGPAGIIAGGAL
ncbi:MAG: DNA repair exonuclease [Candidatus Accumulibacter phosphatis]|jgi:DNA repair exonuclease SbcCD nuclease subunit|uniref:metallophosphoesterase family protein n=1 Tax=Candidatus Accumulibacter sp. ACC012 TaxID=2823332 RepID=UPI0025C24573|nr:DNA repair exonuclease [Candidatus Accumulibacter sp. ACC012]